MMFRIYKTLGSLQNLKVSLNRAILIARYKTTESVFHQLHYMNLRKVQIELIEFFPIF